MLLDGSTQIRPTKARVQLPERNSDATRAQVCLVGTRARLRTTERSREHRQLRWLSGAHEPTRNQLRASRAANLSD